MTGASPLGPEECAALFARLGRYELLLLAVSGGADSMALLHLAAEWARGATDRPRISAATVDHRLRAESAGEAAWVAGHAGALGVPHETLRWTGEKPSSGIQAKARDARYRLLHDHARSLGRGTAVVTAHHRDDQIETFLMRLARGSGLDGLSGMRGASSSPNAEPPVERPFLDVPKARLVATLAARGLAWIDDPSNADERFERVRLRRARGALEELGLSEDAIARAARRLARAGDALDAATRILMRQAVELNAGAYAAIDRREFGDAPEELRVRLLALLLAAFGGEEEPARLSHIERLEAALRRENARDRTLSGCIIVPKARRIEIFREPGREGLEERPLLRGSLVIWDRRFAVSTRSGGSGGLSVRALGEDGYAGLGGSRAATVKMPYRAAVTLPSIWRDGALRAVPHLDWRDGSSELPEHDVRFLFEPD